MITFEQVQKSYNGKTGCMCGCLGRYTVSSTTDLYALNVEYGYTAYDADNVSDRRVKLAVTKINKAIAMSEDDRAERGMRLYNTEPGYVGICDGNRTTVVYLK
jgi:hypothetical protein